MVYVHLPGSKGVPLSSVFERDVCCWEARIPMKCIVWRGFPDRQYGPRCCPDDLVHFVNKAPMRAETSSFPARDEFAAGFFRPLYHASAPYNAVGMTHDTVAFLSCSAGGPCLMPARSRMCRATCFARAHLSLTCLLRKISCQTTRLAIAELVAAPRSRRSYPGCCPLHTRLSFAGGGLAVSQSRH
jgi:hypothetical protein